METECLKKSMIREENEELCLADINFEGEMRHLVEPGYGPEAQK
jgi:hypothetical protein